LPAVVDHGVMGNVRVICLFQTGDLDVLDLGVGLLVVELTALLVIQLNVLKQHLFLFFQIEL
jgi:hypothetical protein